MAELAIEAGLPPGAFNCIPVQSIAGPRSSVLRVDKTRLRKHRSLQEIMREAAGTVKRSPSSAQVAQHHYSTPPGRRGRGALPGGIFYGRARCAPPIASAHRGSAATRSLRILERGRDGGGDRATEDALVALVPKRDERCSLHRCGKKNVQCERVERTR